MYLAAIDIGTNSVRLLVAETEKEIVVPVRRELAITKLGSGLSSTGRLSERGKQATMQAAAEYVEIARQYGATKIVVFGTCALRQAEDGQAFAHALAARTGQQIEIFSASTEASLSYLGVTQSLSVPKSALVFDLGGGSCELIYCRDNELKVSSYKLGALYLTEKFIEHDPPLLTEVEAIRAHIRRALKVKSSQQVVGVGGTITALASMELKMTHYDADKLHGFILSKDMIKRQLAKMLPLPAHKRSHLVGLPPDRALIMPAGALMVEELLNAAGTMQLTVSQGDILLGSLYAVISSASI
ncbi:MAG: hypothetical protein GX922_02490 [Firmicutes bacterium]|nr:hypothetical protein [Bacillota bacterium]